MGPRASLLFADIPPEWRDPARWPGWVTPALGAGGVVLALLFVVLLVWRLASRRGPAQTVAPEMDESGLREDLARLPPPPPRAAGAVRLTVRGLPVRVRLVVLAPLGRGAVILPDQAVDLLDHVLNGLTMATRQDRARVRLWPAQLSGHGFHPRFLRLVHRPEASHEPSPWVLVAGQARLVGARQVLVGLALLADKPVILEGLAPEPDQWYDVLRVAQRG